MCGIGGIRRFGETAIDPNMVKTLLVALETRGNDASGVAIQQENGDLNMLKSDDSAWRFVKQENYLKFIEENLRMDSKCVLVHTRAATKGSPRVNKNNHPLFHKNSMVIHNGVIQNDDELFKQLKIDRHAETDSDIFRGILDRFGVTPEAIGAFNKLRGSAAIAGFHPQYPGKLIIGRSGSPLTLGSTDDLLIFASEKNIVHRVGRPWEFRFGIPFQKQALELGFSPFPDNTCWIIGDKGMEFFASMATTYGTYREPIRRIYNGYQDRQRKWDSEVVEESEKEGDTQSLTLDTSAISENEEGHVTLNCPNCKKALGIPPDLMGIDLADLECPKEKGGCGLSLAPLQPN